MPKRSRNSQLAVCMSVVPGLGQLYNFEWRKAIFFFFATVLTIVPSILLIVSGQALGHTLLERRYFTAFLLLAFFSILLFLMLFIAGLAFWASAAVDAWKSAKDLSAGLKSNSRWWLFHL